MTRYHSIEQESKESEKKITSELPPSQWLQFRESRLEQERRLNRQLKAMDHQPLPVFTDISTAAGAEKLAEALSKGSTVVASFPGTSGTWFAATPEMRVEVGKARLEDQNHLAVVSLVSTSPEQTMRLIDLDAVHPGLKGKAGELIDATLDICFLRWPPSQEAKQKYQPYFASDNGIQLWTMGPSPLTKALAKHKLAITAVRSGNVTGFPEATTQEAAANYASQIHADVVAYNSQIDEQNRQRIGSQPIAEIPEYKRGDNAAIFIRRPGNTDPRTLIKLFKLVVPDLKVAVLEEKAAPFRRQYTAPATLDTIKGIRRDLLRASGLENV